jgi:hypothetical protein
MLFDLRSRSRRTLVRVVYIGLAVLIGLGLVGFGIGGGFGSGGIFSAASENNEGSSGASFAAQVAKYRKLTQKQPTNPAAWEGLTKALLHEAGPQVENGLSQKGREIYKEAGAAWQSYLALNPKQPNTELAQLMLNVYGTEGLNEPTQAIQAVQVAIAAQPNRSALYQQLALYAYKAKDARTGDLASAKAVSLAPPSQQARVRTELAEIKANPSGEKTYTTTSKGKTFAVKKATNGTFTGTAVTPAPAPPGGSTTTSTTKK